MIAREGRSMFLGGCVQKHHASTGQCVLKTTMTAEVQAINFAGAKSGSKLANRQVEGELQAHIASSNLYSSAASSNAAR